MAYRGPLLLLLVPLLASFLWIGCDSGGSSPETEPPEEPPAGGGAVSFTLARAADSNIPASADSAIVRIWQPSGSFNLKRIVNIPNPGQQTEVSFSVPADTSYRAGVLAVEPRDLDPTDKKILAHGSSDSFNVQADDTSRVSLDVRPADLTVELPSQLTPGVTDTLKSTYNVNVSDIDETLFARQGSTPQFQILDGVRLDRVGREIRSDSTVVQSFSIVGPDTNTEDTTYVKVQVSMGSSTAWEPPGRRLIPRFFPSREGSSFEIPVVPSESNNGTVIITFSSDGTMTRRVVR